MYNHETSYIHQDDSSLTGMYDPLTQMFNSALFIEVTESLICISVRNNMPVSLAILGIDNYFDFKKKYGVVATQHLMQDCADSLKSFARDSDVLSHIDEDKFAVLLNNCNFQSSQWVAKRLHDHLDGHILMDKQPVTFSIGLAEFKDTELAQHKGHISKQLISDAMKSLA